MPIILFGRGFEKEEKCPSLAPQWIFYKPQHTGQDEVTIFMSSFTYNKVASSSMSWWVAHFQIVRRLNMKGKFDAYAL